MLDDARYLAVIEAESRLFVAALGDDLDLVVDSCPEWNLAELTLHLGQVLGGVEEVVRTRASAPGPAYEDQPDDEAQLVPWFEAIAARLVETLRSAHPTARVWSWWRDKTPRFWLRRMALEITVHRWDAQATTGEPTPIDEDIAADGIDEMLTVHLFDDPGAPWPDGPTLGFVVATAGPAWRVSTGPRLVEVTRTGGSADMSVVGSAEDLLLLLWGRRSPEVVSIEGDPDLLDRFLAW